MHDQLKQKDQKGIRKPPFPTEEERIRDQRSPERVRDPKLLKQVGYTPTMRHQANRSATTSDHRAHRAASGHRTLGSYGAYAQEKTAMALIRRYGD